MQLERDFKKEINYFYGKETAPLNQLYISPLRPDSKREFKAGPKFKVDKNKERLKKMLSTKLHVNTLSKNKNSGSVGNLSPNKNGSDEFRKGIKKPIGLIENLAIEGNCCEKLK